MIVTLWTIVGKNHASVTSAASLLLNSPNPNPNPNPCFSNSFLSDSKHHLLQQMVLLFGQMLFTASCPWADALYCVMPLGRCFLLRHALGHAVGIFFGNCLLDAFDAMLRIWMGAEKFGGARLGHSI